MTIARGYAVVADRIAEARAALIGTHEAVWTTERKTGWLDALDEIEVFLAGEEKRGGFSIIRSLDGTAGVDGATSATILAVLDALKNSGIDRFN